jgi:PHP family Zn ribbon phosphoesterase
VELGSYRGDLHNHTFLSPCGDIEMTPRFIVSRAREKGYSIVGITDHNTTRQCPEIHALGQENGILVLCGAEITTREEVHCLAFVEDRERLDKLQEYLSKHLPPIPNVPEKFGYQLWVDRDENILGEEEYLLISAIDQSLEQVEAFIRSLDGIFVLAHVNKSRDSVISQLGFIPFDLKPDSLEISARCDFNQLLQTHKYLSKYRFIRSSDAHYQEDFLSSGCTFHIRELSFAEVAMALRGQEGRFISLD